MTTYSNPGPIGDVPPSPNVVEETWGNAIRDRVVRNFVDDTERDTEITTPVEGMFCYLASDHVLQQYAGPTDGWQPPWSLPWGVLAPTAAITAPVTGFTSDADVPGVSSGALTVVANRLIRVHVHGRVLQNTSTGLAKVAIQDGSTRLLNVLDTSLAATGREVFDGAYEYSPTAGTHTWKLRAGTSAGTLDVVASTNGDPGACFITVQDIGPAGAPS